MSRTGALYGLSLRLHVAQDDYFETQVTGTLVNFHIHRLCRSRFLLNTHGHFHKGRRVPNFFISQFFLASGMAGENLGEIFRDPSPKIPYSLEILKFLPHLLSTPGRGWI